MIKKIRQEHTREELDRLDRAADDFAILVRTDPEEIATEPMYLRVSLSLDHAEEVLSAYRQALIVLTTARHYVAIAPEGTTDNVYTDLASVDAVLERGRLLDAS